MDDRDVELDFEDLGGEPDDEPTGDASDCATFYWALKNALERARWEQPPNPTTP